MYSIGRVCVKVAGRDAGKYCVIVDQIDNNHVMIDGQTRRRKCNIHHLEPINISVKLAKGADRNKVVSALKDAGIVIEEKTSKGSKDKKASRPKKAKASKKEPVIAKKGKKSKEKRKPSGSAEEKAGPDKKE